MKRILAFCLILVFAASCGSDKNKQLKSNTNRGDIPETDNTVTQEQEQLTQEQKVQLNIDNTIQEELTGAKKVNGIISGFQFGMSTSRVERHTKKMMKRGNLRKVKKSSHKFEYVYRLPLSKKKQVDTYMDFDYRDGGVFKANCKIKTPRGEATSDILNQTKDLLQEWYGDPKFDLPQHNSCNRYLWIDGNRHVDLKCEMSGVEFTYTDLTEEIPGNFFGTEGPQIEVSDIEYKEEENK